MCVMRLARRLGIGARLIWRPVPFHVAHQPTRTAERPSRILTLLAAMLACVALSACGPERPETVPTLAVNKLSAPRVIWLVGMEGSQAFDVPGSSVVRLLPTDSIGPIRRALVLDDACAKLSEHTYGDGFDGFERGGYFYFELGRSGFSTLPSTYSGEPATTSSRCPLPPLDQPNL